jgi:glycosyltransferase involved in cell wall biosynthesis
MSEIPPFREHVEFLGIRAEMFDPRNATDICRAMRVLLANPELAAEMAEESRQAFQRYTWKTVATEYLQVFRGAAGGL